MWASQAGTSCWSTGPTCMSCWIWKLGRCRMCVAGPEDFYDDPNKTLRGDQVPHIAGEYYESRSRDIDIIKLNGSIELAPSWGCPM